MPQIDTGKVWNDALNDPKPPNTATVGTPGSGKTHPGAGIVAYANALVNEGFYETVDEAKAAIRAYTKEHPGVTPKVAANKLAERSVKSEEGGTSSGSSSSSGYSSSGGGSVATGPSPQTIANTKASYASMLATWGIPMSPKLNTLINHAATSGMGSSTFLQALRKTKDYAARFVGIMKNDGTMRMTEAQYLSGYQSAKDYAASVGRALSPAAYGMAIKNGNSPSEIKQKVEALDILKTNGAILSEFGDYLAATGVTKKPPTKQEMLAFVMKQGPKVWEQTWQTVTQAAAIEKFSEEAIQIGRGGDNDVSYKELQRLQKGLLPGEQPDYQALGQVLDALPASKLYKLGLSKKDAVTLLYGGPGAKDIFKRAQLAVGTAQAAATEQRANPRLDRQGMDLGRDNLQATE
jgi:hypothetical protein